MSRVERLKEKLKKALAAEHYEEAARLRDELKRFESGN
jgi:protein-arginine kinase activator protein McsA